MTWFKRLRRKLRNYTASGDYPGGYGDRSSGPSSARTDARFGHDITRIRDTSGPTN